MSSSTDLEFLLISSDYKTLTAVTEGVGQMGASLGFVPTWEAARDYVGRRRIDGIFVDLEIPGALELIKAIREGDSNRYTMVFACRGTGFESPEMAEAQVNYVLQKPLTPEVIVRSVAAAEDLMARERRRYFRHPVSMPVILKASDTEQRGMMTNLSEGGMAVRVAKPLEYRSVIDFAFELAIGSSISGKGLITWINSDGMVGVAFQFLRGEGQGHLITWLARGQSISPTLLVANA